MRVTLYGGPLDGLETEAPEPLPPRLRVDTEQGEVRRIHVYLLHDGRYLYLRTEKKGPRLKSD